MHFAERGCSDPAICLYKTCQISRVPRVRFGVRARNRPKRYQKCFKRMLGLHSCRTERTGDLKSINIPLGKHRVLEKADSAATLPEPLENVYFLGGPGSTRAQAGAAPSAGLPKVVLKHAFWGAFWDRNLGNHWKIKMELPFKAEMVTHFAPWARGARRGAPESMEKHCLEHRFGHGFLKNAHRATPYKTNRFLWFLSARWGPSAPGWQKRYQKCFKTMLQMDSGPVGRGIALRNMRNPLEKCMFGACAFLRSANPTRKKA